MKNENVQPSIISVFVEPEEYSRITSGGELTGKLGETLANLETDPVFRFVRKLAEKSGINTRLTTLPFEVYNGTKSDWARYEPTELLDELSKRFSRKLNEQRPTLSVRLGRLEMTLGENTRSSKDSQIIAGACFLASLSEAIDIAKLIQPTETLNGFFSTIHTSEGKGIPLSMGLRIHHNLSPELNSNGPKFLGYFSPDDKLYPVVTTLQKSYPDDIMDADHKFLYFRTPFPLEILLAEINGDNNIINTPMAVATAWQRFSY